MIQKHIITNILIILLLACSFASVPAGAVSAASGSSENGLFEKLAALSQYGIENWTDPASPIYDPAVLKAYGKVPPINNSMELNVFADKLRSVRENSWNEISFYPNGSVVLYGADPVRGYFLVELYDDRRGKIAYSDNDTREIYDIIDKYTLENGIENVPVAFTLTNDASIVGFVEFPVYWYDVEDIFITTENDSYVEELKGEPTFITARGTMPIFIDEEEKMEWYDQLQKCSRSNSKLSRYISISEVPFVGAGVNSKGYFVIEFDKQKPEKVNGSVIAEVYNVIDEHCEQKGIKDVPVVFVFADMPVLDEEIVAEMSNDSNTTKQSPGFTSAMPILSLLFLVGINRKLF